MEHDLLHLFISWFRFYFLDQTVYRLPCTSFKILNDIRLYTVRSITFNLDHEMDSLHFISNRKDPCL
jgi:hypothetical protein